MACSAPRFLYPYRISMYDNSHSIINAESGKDFFTLMSVLKNSGMEIR